MAKKNKENPQELLIFLYLTREKVVAGWPLDQKVRDSSPRTRNEWKNDNIFKIPPWTYFQFTILQNLPKIGCLLSLNLNFLTNKKRGMDHSSILPYLPEQSSSRFQSGWQSHFPLIRLQLPWLLQWLLWVQRKSDKKK